MFAHIVEGRLRHPAVTEAVRQGFLETREYRNAAKCAIRYQSEPKAGGIEIMTSPSLPPCTDIRMSADKKFLRATFNGTKYWLPISPIGEDAVFYLIYTTILDGSRLCIDISACGSFYIVHLDGYIGSSTDIAKTMERADFLLGAMSFGRDPRTGALFEPKKGQLPGYKNPVLEEARLLREDAQFAAARCQYIDVWPYPTLVYDTPFSFPEEKWWDVWPNLQFPKSYFRVTWRLVMLDLCGKQAFYDIPEDNVDTEAKVLLRPYQALMDSVRQHGADWIESEPDLCKVNLYAKVFQVLSRGRTSSNLKNITIPPLTETPPMACSTTVDERADFRLPLPSSSEIDDVGQALESAFTTAIVGNPDDLTRAAQYKSLGMSCSRQNKFDKAALHFLVSAKTPVEWDCAKEGIRDSLTSALDSIYQAPTDWVFQQDETKYPQWWKLLQTQFGDALHVVTRVLREPRFQQMEGSQAQIAAPLVAHILLVHLAHEMLIQFEELEDLDGIRRICGFMARLYHEMKERGIPVNEDESGNAEGRWSSVAQASRDLQVRLFANTDRADPFKVLDKVLQDDVDESLSAIEKKLQQDGYTSTDLLTDPLGSSAFNSKQMTSEGKVEQAEQAMDAYFIQGDIAAALACALVLVDDERVAEAASTFAERKRFWTKASTIAEYAYAQQNLLSAKELVAGVRTTLDKRLYRTTGIESKAALLSYLTEASTLLEPCKRLFPRASEAMMGLIYSTMARVHRAWLDSDTASKWTMAAKAREEAAKAESDELGTRYYAREWLLDDKNKRKEDALKCTEGWRAMVATLVCTE
ncbi:hypothetical protein EMPS_08789 [Entomortierella parvispora]|uniref:Uncharacterized protein n=1 Tax=Entomortierella parvispora TaxID=205924 RepID=A0A9P3HH34_9FUNG|nr:hypothetical protein EMPS_08789 [Entomortierella parvispora]